tara:strand:- start:110 stop:2227 length:2118 start_codon:yes stop_codon:yes gene_type:complete
MIKILNADNSFNKEAAIFLKEKIVKLWPDLEDHEKDLLQIHCGTRTTSGKTEDIDLTILASFDTPRAYKPTWEKYNDIEIIWVKTICCAVEVKHVPSQDIKIGDGDIKVRRRDSYENVTEQNHNQRFALLNTFKNLLKVKDEELPFVTSNILLMQANSTDFVGIDSVKEKAFFRDCDFEDFLQKLTGQKALRIMKKHQARFNCGPSKDIEKALNCDLFKTVEASPVTLKRIENITKAFTEDVWRKGWLDDIGNKQVILEGRGGTGKTVLLLSFAQNLAKEQKKKIIVLTYNHALVTELKRLSNYLSIDPDLLIVRTVMGYLISITKYFGFNIGLGDSRSFQRRYEETLSKFIKWIDKNPEQFDKGMKKLKESGIKNPKIPGTETVDNIFPIDPDEDGKAFDFDYWFVDEGQDFKETEKNLLRKLFGIKNSVISIGKGQWTRDFQENNVTKNDWTKDAAGLDIPDDFTTTRRLRKVLRSNQMLVKMVQELNKKLEGEDLNIEASEALGGKIVVVEGSYFDDPLLHKRIIEESEKAGCSKVNLLFCTQNHEQDESSANETIIGLEELGIEAWDGLKREVRQQTLQNEDNARVVYYQSCRGLEGWAVICRKFDIFWESVLATSSKNKKMKVPPTLFPDDEVSNPDVRQEVVNHILIPFTRATNTLVLEIYSKETFLGNTLYEMSKDPNTRDIIEWRDPDHIEKVEISF